MLKFISRLYLPVRKSESKKLFFWGGRGGGCEIYHFINCKNIKPVMFCIFPKLNKKKHPPEVFYKKVVLKNFAKFTGNHLCQSLCLNKVACNFIKEETLAPVISCELCKIFKNTFFIEHLWWLLQNKIRRFMTIQRKPHSVSRENIR